MDGPVLVFLSLVLVVTVSTFCEGEGNVIQKLLFAVFTLGGYGAFGAYVYLHQGQRPSPTYMVLLGLFCCATLAWAYHLDLKGRTP